MSAVGCIQQSSKALIILMVHPVGDFLFLDTLIECGSAGLFAFFESFAGFLDEELYDVEVSLIGELVQYGVVLGVGELDDV